MAAPTSSLLADIGHEGISKQRLKVMAFVNSSMRSVQEQLRRSPFKRGILINAGGKKLLTNLVILLKVLREHHKCQLPVEIAWQGKHEMDDDTFQALKSSFGPLYGFDITEMPYPAHHRDISSHWPKYVGKTYSLLHTRFQEVLMLDADNLPLRDPSYLFDTPEYRKHGNTFWPDYWASWVPDKAYEVLGLNATLTKAAVNYQKGFKKRDTESGQMVLDRVRHMDALEYVFLINSYSDVMYKIIHGDKDTFALGFALANKAHEFTQNSIPPGAAMRYGLHLMVQPKDLTMRMGAYQLAAMLQFDYLGRPLFFHRTKTKVNVDQEAPVEIDLLTGPAPYRWVRYYIDDDAIGDIYSYGPRHAAPPEAFVMHEVAEEVHYTISNPSKSEWTHLLQSTTCKLEQYMQYRTAMALALPLELPRDIATGCRGLEDVVKPLVEHSVTNLSSRLAGKSEVGSATLSTREALLSPMYLEHLVYDASGKETPDGTPIAALKMTENLRGGPHDALRAAKEAFYWLKDNRDLFPILAE